MSGCSEFTRHVVTLHVVIHIIFQTGKFVQSVKMLPVASFIAAFYQKNISEDMDLVYNNHWLCETLRDSKQLQNHRPYS